MTRDRGRSGTSARDAAEKAFRTATTRAPEAAARPAIVPGVRESVTLRIDAAVLAHFQADGPGWQDRINEALLKLVADAS